MLFKYLILAIPLFIQEPQVIGVYGHQSEDHPMGGVGSDGVYYQKLELKLFDDNSFELLRQHGGLYNTKPRVLTVHSGTYEMVDSVLVLSSSELEASYSGEKRPKEKSKENFHFELKNNEFCYRKCLSRWEGKFPSDLISK
jgi:hypothetical protein